MPFLTVCGTEMFDTAQALTAPVSIHSAPGSINHYVAALRSAALHCEFKDLDNALLDCLVCGVKDLHLKRWLLAKSEVTFQSALDEAREAEMSTQLLAVIQNNPIPQGSTSLSAHQVPLSIRTKLTARLRPKELMK